ncbi:MAG TPA: phosphatidylserine decarboxylase family protein [Elusimicrobia bacterium]|jgi:phosphatidylserine decarboxylase|nr:phosphatidylserine decarboxylase family protein [Elusimicrobiota bacterium]
MRLPIAKEGWSLVNFFLLFTVAGYILGKFSKIFYLFALCSLLLAIFLLYFFRDPERIITQDENIILSPADGRIIGISNENGYKVIKIFMSPFNVHIQRAPLSGEVVSIEYKKGKFLPAQKENASFENEQNLVSIEHRPARQYLAGGAKSKENFISGNQRDLEKSAVIRVTVKQIAGILVRRIVCWTKIGDCLNQGQKIGIIMFGSQVDIALPENIDLKVKLGDKVKAGLNILASLIET